MEFGCRGDASRLHRIKWNQRYIIYTDDNRPTEWTVIAVKEHREFTVTDIQRTQDSRFKQITTQEATKETPERFHCGKQSGTYVGTTSSAMSCEGTPSPGSEIFTKMI